MIKSKEIFGIGISKEVFDVFITDKGYLKFPNKKKDLKNSLIKCQK